ncbi:HAMP domain-containing sensor histidine kinase [Thiolinea disciformis]|uniref:HAMP domain-containing sensor histidine kinase n=1 Tax=Thiolinea disciformis TaxID=125614 RepID=UPI000378080E|nr:HAMP domain-containing sensor histidine kinase [Thiolinea disciformis]
MLINAQLPLPRRIRFSLRSILLIMMLTLLLLPLAGLYFFRIYENELVRQTELELISQSAVLAANYRQIISFIHPNPKTYGYLTPDSPLIGGKMIPAVPSKVYASTSRQTPTPEAYYTPITPELDLVRPILPPRPPAWALSQPLPDPYALKVGKAMQSVIQNTQQVTLVGVRILDMNGLVVGGREENRLSMAHIPEIKQALSGYYASTIRQRRSDEPSPPLYSISRGTNIRVFTAFPIMEGQRLQGVIYLSRTPKNILKHLYTVQDKLYMVTALLLAIAIFLVVFVSSSISRPIRELIHQTQLVAKGEQTKIAPIKHPVTYEIAQLSDSFASMSHTLAERSDYIRRFATHVSHEFKTPLTSMQGALELLQEHFDAMTPERRQHFLDNLLSDTQRLKNLVNRLLELARADALEPSTQTTPWPDFLQTVKNRYQERGLSLELLESPNVELAIAPDALETVLCNLFDNSLSHGATKVVIRGQPIHHQLQLQVHDNGEGISAANRERIFTPFFTTRRNTGGTGLGLEISLSLLKAYNGHIQLGSATEGAEFLLHLPLA